MSQLENIILKYGNSVLDLPKTNDPIGKPVDEATQQIKELFTELIDRVQISEELSPQAHLGKRACQMNLRELVNKL